VVWYHIRLTIKDERGLSLVLVTQNRFVCAVVGRMPVFQRIYVPLTARRIKQRYLHLLSFSQSYFQTILTTLQSTAGRLTVLHSNPRQDHDCEVRRLR